MRIYRRLCCALTVVLATSGCYQSRDYDKYNMRVDPDIEIKRVFELSGKTYLDVAYHVLSEAKSRPGTRSFTLEMTVGYTFMHSDAEKFDGRNRLGFRVVPPNLVTSRASANDLRAVWYKKYPDMVFFMHGVADRYDHHMPLYRYYRDSQGGGERVNRVMLVFHPGQLPPFTEQQQNSHPAENGKNNSPRSTENSSKWKRRDFKKNWSLYY